MNNAVRLLADAAREFPNADALITDNSTISYGRYYQLALSTCERLRQHGIGPGDYVAIIAETDIRYPILLNALWMAGAVACPINPRFPGVYVGELLGDVGCRFIAGDSTEFLSELGDRFKTFEIEKLVDISASGETPGTSGETPADIHRPATVIFTSGSTSHPKAVLHSLANHYFNALGSADNIPFEGDDRWLLSLPLYHVGGLSIIFRAMVGGAAVVIPSDRHDILGCMRRGRITHASVVTTQLARLLRENEDQPVPSALKALLVGGSHISTSLLRQALEHGWPVHTSYGLTEMASQVATTRSGDKESVLGGAAEILPYRELKVADDGEILVKGETLFLGYVSAKALSPSRDNNGWFHTGDLGEIDNRGCVRITGRRDNMFISGGENIQPEEIEKVALEHCRVNQFVVVPVADVEFGQRPVAFVEGDIDEDEIKSILKRFLPSFKLPLRIFPWPALQTLEGIKPGRTQLTQLAAHLMREMPY